MICCSKFVDFLLFKCLNNLITYIFANYSGRKADTDTLGLDKVGIIPDAKDGKIIVDKTERTQIKNIFAIGDVAKVSFSST